VGIERDDEKMSDGIRCCQHKCPDCGKILMYDENGKLACSCGWKEMKKK